MIIYIELWAQGIDFRVQGFGFKVYVPACVPGGFSHVAFVGSRILLPPGCFCRFRV